MNYYLIYNQNDDLTYYVDNLDELLTKFLPNYRKRDVIGRFKKSNYQYITIIIDNKLYKVFQFFD